MTAPNINVSNASRSLTVLRTGPLALIQDAGRVGYAADGVSRSGAADRASYGLANRVVGNPAGAAAIECTLGGLAVRAETDLFVAVTGATVPAEIDRKPITLGRRVLLARGETLRLRSPRTGLRSYLAIGGGIAVPTVLGSRSSDTLSGLGPAPLANGDVVPIGPANLSDGPGELPAEPGELPTGTTPNEPDHLPPATVLTQLVTTLRVLLGPRDDWFANPDALAVGEWQVSPNSNRVGLRLDRASSAAGDEPVALRRSVSREMPSEGLPLGAIQVPPGGQPVLFLADQPLTGGYPVIAVVLDDDIDRAAQVRPGQRLRFLMTPGNTTKGL
jgi:biotin-dependent carboxylase-like uncharacterized protein